MIAHYLIQAVFAMLGTLAFAILFHAKKSEYVFCTLNGMIGWMIYLLLVDFAQTGSVIASLIATFMLTLIARLLAAIRQEPATTYLVTGIFTLVPGAGIYNAAYYLIMTQYSDLVSSATLTLKIAIAIAIGIIFGFAVPQKLFHRLVRRKSNPRG